jgi:hypothetical protein
MSLLLLTAYNNTVLSVDEDYFIPYTDNYGYEYDPETGTYIKTEPAPTNSVNQQQSSGAHETTTALTQQSAPTMVQADQATQDSAYTTPILLASTIIIVGALLVLTKRLGKSKEL